MLSDLLKSDKDPYWQDDLVYPLMLYQALQNKVLDEQEKDHDHIQHVHVLTIRPNTQQNDLENQIRNLLPIGIGNFSIFMVHTANEREENGHWNAAVARIVDGRITIRYNDSNEGTMPSVLYNAFKSIKSDINIVDHKVKHEGGENVCGMWTMMDIVKMVWKPYEPLEKREIHNPAHIELLKIFHKLYGFSSFIQKDFGRDEVLLNMFKAIHDLETSEENIRAIEINVKALYIYLEAIQVEKRVQWIKESVLTECSEKLKDHNRDLDGKHLQFYEDYLKPLVENEGTVVKEYTEDHKAIRDTLVDHGSKGAEEAKESLVKSVLSNYPLEGGHSISIYTDGSKSLTYGEKEYCLLSELALGEMKGETYGDGSSTFHILWTGGLPDLINSDVFVSLSGEYFP